MRFFRHSAPALLSAALATAALTCPAGASEHQAAQTIVDYVDALRQLDMPRIYARLQETQGAVRNITSSLPASLAQKKLNDEFARWKDEFWRAGYDPVLKYHLIMHSKTTILETTFQHSGRFGPHWRVFAQFNFPDISRAPVIYAGRASSESIKLISSFVVNFDISPEFLIRSRTIVEEGWSFHDAKSPRIVTARLSQNTRTTNLEILLRVTGGVAPYQLQILACKHKQNEITVETELSVLGELNKSFDNHGQGVISYAFRASNENQLIVSCRIEITDSANNKESAQFARSIPLSDIRQRLWFFDCYANPAAFSISSPSLNQINLYEDWEACYRKGWLLK